MSLGKAFSKNSCAFIKLLSRRSFFFTCFRLPPYGTGVSFTFRTPHIFLGLTVMALCEQICADDNLTRWH